VLSWGEREAAQLISDVGRRAWVTGIEPVRSALRDSDVVRILGFGRLLTEYIIAPLRISALARPATVRLGSLANFIVTFYDLLLDQGVGAGEILPRKVLSARARGAGWLIAWQSLTGSAPARLVAQLVALYFACFEDIALRGSRSEQVGSLLRRFIIRMHEAELLTRVAGPMNHRTVRRKAALPFAVMGLPGWLSACPPMTPREHLSWCYRLGLYFGRLDDAIDLESDYESGQLSRLATGLSGDRDPVLACNRYATGIARQGRRVATQWRAWVGPTTKEPISQALELTTCSWFGGIGWRPTLAVETPHAPS